MHIVIAPDSFKESLSAIEVAKTIQKAFEHYYPNAKYTLLPLADGGEGTVDAVLFAKKGEYRTITVQDPLGRSINAYYGLIDDGETAIIELAQASGLPLLTVDERNPAITSTYGTGELIRDALDKGVKKIVLGLGGSATNDAGTGIIAALGGKLLNSQGAYLQPGGLDLINFDYLNLDDIDSRIKTVELILACDVQNPLLGLNGASHIFGPQKGADSQLVNQLDASFTHFAQKIQATGYVIDANYPSMGAAGGATFGLSLLNPNLKIVSGIDFILDTLDFKSIIGSADLVITGEGKMDNQTLAGKTPFGVARQAKAFHLPVIGMAGILGDEIDKLAPYFDVIFPIIPALKPLEHLLDDARVNLSRTATQIAALLQLSRTHKS